MAAFRACFLCFLPPLKAATLSVGTANIAAAAAALHATQFFPRHGCVLSAPWVTLPRTSSVVHYGMACDQQCPHCHSVRRLGLAAGQRSGADPAHLRPFLGRLVITTSACSCERAFGAAESVWALCDEGPCRRLAAWLWQPPGVPSVPRLRLAWPRAWFSRALVSQPDSCRCLLLCAARLGLRGAR